MSKYVHMTDEHRHLLCRSGLGELGAVFAWRAGQRLDKPGLQIWRQRWRVCLSDGTSEPAERTFYLKRFDRPPLRQQLQRWRQGYWRLSTAGVEWRNARQLAAVNVATAQPAAFGQEMVGPWERRSFVLMSEVKGESLERWVPKCLPPTDREDDLRRRRMLIDRLARFVAGFHTSGFVHRDLYLSHIFISNIEMSLPAHAGGGEVFTLIDLQRVFRPNWRRRRWVVKDLAALNYSTPSDRVGRRERLRFLCRYARLCGRFGSARRLAPLIEAKTARNARHERQQNGILQGPAT